jgi:hypothetical protein
MSQLNSSSVLTTKKRRNHSKKNESLNEPLIQKNESLGMFDKKNSFEEKNKEMLKTIKETSNNRLSVHSSTRQTSRGNNCPKIMVTGITNVFK